MTTTPTATDPPAGAPAAPEPTAPAPEPTAPPAEPAGDATAAEVERWKKEARKHEDRAKANAAAAKELEQLRQSQMSDTEKAVAQAKAEAHAEAMRTFGTRLVDEKVRAMTAGRSVDADALLEGLDRNRFLDDSGEPKVDELQAWIDRVAPASTAATPPAPPKPDLGQGPRGQAPALNEDALTRALRTSLGA